VIVIPSVVATTTNSLRISGKSFKSFAATPVSDEAQLSNLRLELGEVLSREAECRSREKRIRTSIKKLQRKVSVQLIADDSSGSIHRVDEDTRARLGQQERTALLKTFRLVKYTVSAVCDGQGRVAQSSCPLWRMAALSRDEGFDEQLAARRLEDSRDAVLSVLEERSAVSISFLLKIEVMDIDMHWVSPQTVRRSRRRQPVQTHLLRRRLSSPRC
jgi:hypothetical protein